MSSDSVSFSSKIKDAIPIEDLESAKAIKTLVEKQSKENCEIVSVVTTITLIEEPKEKVTEQEVTED